MNRKTEFIPDGDLALKWNFKKGFAYVYDNAVFSWCISSLAKLKIISYTEGDLCILTFDNLKEFNKVKKECLDFNNKYN